MTLPYVIALLFVLVATLRVIMYGPVACLFCGSRTRAHEPGCPWKARER